MSDCICVSGEHPNKRNGHVPECPCYRHLTRADIPPGLVAEIQAEALETQAVMMVREIDSMWLMAAAVKLREQKDD